VSGNPGGRPKGFVQAIRSATGDGRELVDVMLTILRGQVRGVRVRDRIDAATWLADRGFGKPTVAAPPDSQDPRPTLEAIRVIFGGGSSPDAPRVYDD
jgi:hypothetical protein